MPSARVVAPRAEPRGPTARTALLLHGGGLRVVTTREEPAGRTFEGMTCDKPTVGTVSDPHTTRRCAPRFPPRDRIDCRECHRTSDRHRQCSPRFLGLALPSGSGWPRTNLSSRNLWATLGLNRDSQPEGHREMDQNREGDPDQTITAPTPPQGRKSGEDAAEEAVQVVDLNDRRQRRVLVCPLGGFPGAAS